MKILIIAPRFHINLYYRIKALEKGDHQVKVLTLYRGVSEFYENIDISQINFSKCFLFLSNLLKKFKKNHLKSFWELKLALPDKKELKKQIKSFNPDIILLKSYQDALSFRVLKIAKKNQIKTIILIQTKKDNLKGSKFLLKLYLNYLRRLNVVYYISATKESVDALNNCGIEEISYIPFAFDVKKFNKNYFRNKKINILSVGKFVRRKNQLLLLKSINLFKKKYSLFVTLIGEKSDLGYFKEVESYIKKNKLKKMIKIKLNLNYKTILKEYKKNDLFILPSYNEPAAYSIVEAMANKLPVICSDSCGTKCYIREGKNGYIFKSKNLNNLVKQIEKIIKNKKNIIGMGKESFRYVQKNHSLKVFNDNFHKAIKKFVLKDD